MNLSELLKQRERELNEQNKREKVIHKVLLRHYGKGYSIDPDSLLKDGTRSIMKLSKGHMVRLFLRDDDIVFYALTEMVNDLFDYTKLKGRK